MFDDENFDFDDDALLHTSFAPVTSSTQSNSPQKRHSDLLLLDKENLKKPKLLNNEPGCSKSVSIIDSASPKNSETIVEISANIPNNRVVKRRFPGPAGLLPERLGSSKSFSDFISDENNIEESQDQILFCSQQTVSVFEDGPWKEMTKDFHVPNSEYLYEKFNISWIKRQAGLKKLLLNHKAPFLAALIQNLEIFDGAVPTINVTLKDRTGDIQGTVLHSLYEDYSDFFTTGSVLVLKQFGVLSLGYNKHCLTITPNNLVTIYCLETSKKPPNESESLAPVSSSDSVVKKIVIQRCSVDEIMRIYNEDVLVREKKDKGIDFKKIHQNHENLFRSRSTGENRIISNNNRIQGNNFVVPEIKNCFNRASGESNTNVNLPLEALCKAIPSDSTPKKKFNFKQNVSLQKLPEPAETLAKSSDVKISSDNRKDSSDNKNCDIIVSSSQSKISVRPDNQEHSEIWKNLLEDVDADALFEDF